MLNYLKCLLALKVREEKGQGMVEYALIIGLVSIVAIGVLVLFGPAIADIFQEIMDKLNTVPVGQ